MTSHKKYHIVKAIADFQAKNDDELSLERRDVLQVIKKEKYWYSGIRNEEIGKFPVSKVVEVNIEHELKNSIGVYIALNTFTKRQKGDLSMNKNDIIIGTKKVDDQWCEGRLLNVPGTGMFPLNFVWKLKENLDDKLNSLNKLPPNSIVYANVLHSMEAQLDEELDLKKDEQVIILGDHDSLYYRGELMNGKQGIFPKSFVQIIKNTYSTIQPTYSSSSSNSQTASHNSSNHRHSSNHYSIENQNYEADNLPSYNEATSWYDKLQKDIPSYGRTLYAFQAEHSDEISFKENQIVNLIKYVDANWVECELDGRVGIAPVNFIEVIVDCSNSASFKQHDQPKFGNEIYAEETEDNCCYEDNNVDIEEFPHNTWGRVLFDFKADMDGDLDLKKGDIIKLNRKFNNDWIEAYNSEWDLGICPFNYVEILSSHELHPEFKQQPHKSQPSRQHSTNQFDQSTPDNLIEFSPEKKNTPSQPNNSAQFTNFEPNRPHQINYDMIHEIEDNYQPTVFKDFKERRNGDSPRSDYEQLKRHSNDESQLSRSNNNENFNSFNNFNSLNNDNNLNNVNKHDNSLNQSTQSSFSSYDTNHNNRSFKEPDYRLPPPPKTRSRSSFKDELNKSLSSRNNLRRNLPETPRRPDVPAPPTSVNYPTLSSLQQSNELESKSPEVKMFDSKRDYVDKRAFSLSPQSPPSITAQDSNDNTKTTNSSRLAKMAEQRSCIITELMQTEKDYRQAIDVCYKTFIQNEKYSTLFRERNVEMRLVFSNLDEIIQVSQKLNDRLLDESTKEVSAQLIGKCFLDLEDEMSRAYGVYCRNHDDSISAFKRYEEDLEVNRFFQRGLEQIRATTNCFDIPSILIKPVQRILKFPLILNELIKCTKNDNEDYEHLQNALRMITDLAQNINGLKRRKDLVCKYRKEAERSNSFSSKLSKLNLHTIRKKYSRINYKITSTIGLSNKSKDTDFDFQLNRFKSLEKTIKTFLKNLNFLMDQLDVYVKETYSLIEEVVVLYGDKCKQPLIERSKECHHEILSKSIVELKSKITFNIVDVLKCLLEKFANPEILIRKRNDKLVDLECATNKYNKSRSVKDEFQKAKELYEALNDQLIQDLPAFSSNGTEIFTNCVVAFITFYKKFIGNIVKQMLELLSLPPILGCKITCSNDIVETFIVKHNLIAMKLVEDFHIVPNNIFPQVVNSQTLATAALDKHKLMKNSKILNTGKTNNKSVYQTKENRLAILSNSKLKPGTIYLVKENFEPNDVLDLFAEKDDIVIVIVTKDPQGNVGRWFVDNGSQKGFLPARILEPYTKNTAAAQGHFNNNHPTPSTSNYPSNPQYFFTNQSYTSDWSTRPSSSNNTNIYSEIDDNATSLFDDKPHEPITILDDFDPIKQQQIYENINCQLDKEEDDINLNRKEPPCNEYMVAAYDFTPVGERQLPLKADDIVIVKYKSDLHNNTEWWYCMHDGRCGYVPSTYLRDR